MGFNRRRRLITRWVGAGMGAGNIYLPQNMIINAGTMLEGFENIDGWSTGVGTKEVNTSEVFDGMASMKVTSGVGTSTTHTKTVNFALNDVNNFIISIYNHGALNTVNNVLFYFSTTGDFSKYFFYSKQLLSPGWNHVFIRKTDITGYGGAVWTDPIIRLRINCTPESGQVSTLSFDRFMGNTQVKPFVLITFDDGVGSTYSKAYAYLQSKNQVGTAYIISDVIDTVGSLTSAQLIEMNASGWDIANHTKTHQDLTGLTQEQVETELSMCKTFLDGLGLTRASSHVAYPYGLRNDTVDAAMTALGMLTGRSVSGGAADNYIAPVDSIFKLPAKNMNQDISLATAKGYIDNIVSHKRAQNLLFHSISDSSAGPTAWKTSDFQELMDYILALGVQTLTISEWYRLLSGGISVTHK